MTSIIEQFKRDVLEAEAGAGGNLWYDGADLLFRGGNGEAVLTLGGAKELVGIIDKLIDVLNNVEEPVQLVSIVPMVWGCAWCGAESGKGEAHWHRDDCHYLVIEALLNDLELP